MAKKAKKKATPKPPETDEEFDRLHEQARELVESLGIAELLEETEKKAEETFDPHSFLCFVKEQALVQVQSWARKVGERLGLPIFTAEEIDPQKYARMKDS